MVGSGYASVDKSIPATRPIILLLFLEITDPMSLEQPSKEITPEQCAAELMEAIPLVMRFIRTQMRSQSASLLSVPQFRTLAFLHRYPGSSLSELAEHLGVTRATASAMTERLVQRNFVSRAEHPKQRRQVVLKLTEDGSAYLEQIRGTTRTKIAGMLNNLSETQLLNLMEGLAILNQVFEESSEPGEH